MKSVSPTYPIPSFLSSLQIGQAISYGINSRASANPWAPLSLNFALFFVAIPFTTVVIQTVPAVREKYDHVVEGPRKLVGDFEGGGMREGNGVEMVGTTRRSERRMEDGVGSVDVVHLTKS